MEKGGRRLQQDAQEGYKLGKCGSSHGDAGSNPIRPRRGVSVREPINTSLLC